MKERIKKLGIYQVSLSKNIAGLLPWHNFAAKLVNSEIGPQKFELVLPVSKKRDFFIFGSQFSYSHTHLS